MDKAISMLDVHESLIVKDISVTGKDIIYNPLFILKSFAIIEKMKAANEME